MALGRFGEICGFHGVVAGLLVAVKHIAPDTELTLLQFAKLRAKVPYALAQPKAGHREHNLAKT